ncbi:hypothetical protein N7497_012312 [Penicillium chrysogenum]|nr:hypothetical protein N7497_012312 [Penicillium chrysogenum]
MRIRQRPTLRITGEWPDHAYFPSPENWRFPVYTLFLDRFVNGDPTNDNVNGTLFEHDINSNQMRHGGDVVGLLDTLDYLQGMGIKGLYLAGLVLMNQPWGSDGYSALDTTLLDQHFGTIQTWRAAITEIHNRGMYVIFDNTVATMGDLIGFEGYMNTTTPFSVKEHKASWKSDRQYVDFRYGNTYNETCDLILASGMRPDTLWMTFGVYPDWKRELAKFASVQDRLREWVPSVRGDLYAIRATQATVNALGDISGAYRDCARRVGKIISSFREAFMMTNASDPDYFIRGQNKQATDAAAFHYSVYRSLTRFLAWYQMVLPNDMVNANTGKFDPRHMYGATNQDVFRWPTVECGIERQLLALFITTLHMPGIPMLLWGEEQAFYILDASAANYIYGRQAMSPATAWKNHGCFQLNSTQYFQWPIESGRLGCHDETVTYDHRDPAHPVRNIIKHMYQMRQDFGALNDGNRHVVCLAQSILPAAGSGEMGNQTVWFVYQNENRTVNYEFDCSDPTAALIAPFDTNTTVKNLFYPHDELTLQRVRKKKFVSPRPMITKFLPGHDAPLLSAVAPDESESVDISLFFSTEMNCSIVTDSISVESSTETGEWPYLDLDSVSCESVEPETTSWTGQIPSTCIDGRATNAIDHFLIRVGQSDNPMIFTTANYSGSLLHEREDVLSLPGSPYEEGNHSIQELPWSGTKKQRWEGKHVRIEYWSRLTGSSDYVQEGDGPDWTPAIQRRFPHLFFNGPFNRYGYDAGLDNIVRQDTDGLWKFRFMTEWPAQAPNTFKWPSFSFFVLFPLCAASTCAYVFKKTFYRIKFNQVGVGHMEDGQSRNPFKRLASRSNFLQSTSAFGNRTGHRRRVLVATMEYEINDWAIKIKIGGLGVMAQLMGKQLGHQDLVWVIPCVGGVKYPIDKQADSMFVMILRKFIRNQDPVHQLRNITYVLLDAPVFASDPSQSPIQPAMKRFPVDMYHINDYHGSVAPLYLLPETMFLFCLSLHNAEFQGLWPMRTQKEKTKVCSVFNLDLDVVTRYVQFGEIFNILHAGASYLRLHQQGFGAVAVSKKYGKRSYARYPIFWAFKKSWKFPDPDPSDTGEWDKALHKEDDINVDNDFENCRTELKRQAQEWAGLEQRPDADLLVFVGRWSMQKGIDLIADVLPSVLESREHVQLICIGPLIDLYGKFAALKLDRMMKLYPGRVCSKPQFTVLPQFIFSGADFALIPSRDEPFGLVAVEFGRKGALVESTTTSHLLKQFKLAIDIHIDSSPSKGTTRAQSQSTAAGAYNAIYGMMTPQAASTRSGASTPPLQPSSRPVVTQALDTMGDLGRDSVVRCHTAFGRVIEGDDSAGRATPEAEDNSDDEMMATCYGDDDYSISPEGTDPGRAQTPQPPGVALTKEALSAQHNQLCIEQYLEKSEKKWFNKFRDARLGLDQGSPAGSVHRGKAGTSPNGSVTNDDATSHESGERERKDAQPDEFLLGDDYVPPTGLKKWMQMRIGEWPVYSLPRTGPNHCSQFLPDYPSHRRVGQTATKLYGIATVYLITFYSMVVFLPILQIRARSECAMVPIRDGLFGHWNGTLLEPNSHSRGWIQNVGSSLYAAASSSGSIFFALNFGDESGAPVKQWVFRACLIQGTQQAYVIALWYWGSTLTKATNAGVMDVQGSITNTWRMTAICTPITLFLWAIGLIVYFGLPNYYRQTPGKMPSFYKSVFRRKIVLWNWVVVILQNFFLSAPYGRNWNFLWISQHASPWQILLLCVAFFGFAWIVVLFLLARLSKSHSWILPVLACGLGAPRWPKSGGVHWGPDCSSLGWKLYLGGSCIPQPLALARDLGWHYKVSDLVLGSIATICARAFAPNNIGPGPISPDITAGAGALGNAWFWVALLLQLSICGGFLLFFRREQLSKP